MALYSTSFKMKEQEIDLTLRKQQLTMSSYVCSSATRRRIDTNCPSPRMAQLHTECGHAASSVHKASDRKCRSQSMSRPPKLPVTFAEMKPAKEPSSTWP